MHEARCTFCRAQQLSPTKRTSNVTHGLFTPFCGLFRLNQQLPKTGNSLSQNGAGSRPEPFRAGA